MVHKSNSGSRGGHLLKNLKKQINRHVFESPRQAGNGGTIIGREKITSVGKNATGQYCGRAALRKREFLERQEFGSNGWRGSGLGSAWVVYGLFRYDRRTLHCRALFPNRKDLHK